MKPWIPLGLGLGLVAALTVLFWTTDLDLRGPAMAYRPEAPHWPLARWWPCSMLYDFGPWPGLLLALGAGAGWVASFGSKERRPWRTPCLLIFLLAALGPGLLVNGILKNLMGRPRPYETTGFGGTQTFLRPFEPGVPFHGSSFVSGHAAMAFLFVGLFFVLRGPGRWMALLGGVSFGLAVGWSRVVRGDHYPSDILLAGALDFVLGAALALALGRGRGRGVGSNSVYSDPGEGHNDPPSGEIRIQGD